MPARVEKDASDAAKMNSVSYNIGRALAPALGVLLIATLRPNLIFALNALSFVVFAAILRHLTCGEHVASACTLRPFSPATGDSPTSRVSFGSVSTLIAGGVQLPILRSRLTPLEVVSTQSLGWTSARGHAMGRRRFTEADGLVSRRFIAGSCSAASRAAVTSGRPDPGSDSPCIRSQHLSTYGFQPAPGRMADARPGSWRLTGRRRSEGVGNPRGGCCSSKIGHRVRGGLPPVV